MNVEKTKKAVKAIDDLVEVLESAMSDGKIDFVDTLLMPNLVKVAQEFYEAFGDRKVIIEELKDLDMNEFKELLDEAFDN